MAEEVLKHYGRRSKLDPLIIRLSNGYGPPVGESTSCWPLVLNDLCKQAIELGEIHLLSDGTPQRDFIYIDDAVMAISKLLKLSGHRESEIFNIGGGRTYSIMELALEVSRINRDRIGREVPVILKDGNILTTADKSIRQEMDFTYDITAARESGITPQINLEEGINRLFDYLGESMQ
jgi:nucleoside-diphosphate-sugar epimerase